MSGVVTRPTQNIPLDSKKTNTVNNYSILEVTGILWNTLPFTQAGRTRCAGQSKSFPTPLCAAPSHSGPADATRIRQCRHSGLRLALFGHVRCLKHGAGKHHHPVQRNGFSFELLRVQVVNVVDSGQCALRLLALDDLGVMLGSLRQTGHPLDLAKISGLQIGVNGSVLAGAPPAALRKKTATGPMYASMATAAWTTHSWPATGPLPAWAYC